MKFFLVLCFSLLVIAQEAAILDLCNKYTVAQNNLDAAGTAKLFTSDAVAELPAGSSNVVKGNAAILAAYKNIFAGFKMIRESSTGDSTEYGYQIAGNAIGHMKMFYGLTNNDCAIFLPVNQAFIYNSTSGLFSYTSYVVNTTAFGMQMNCK